MTTTTAPATTKPARQTSQERILEALRAHHYENIQVADTEHTVDRPYDPPRYYGRSDRQEYRRLAIVTRTVTAEYTIYSQYGPDAGTEEARVQVSFVFDAEGRFQKEYTDHKVLGAQHPHGLHGYEFRPGSSLTALLKVIEAADPVQAKANTLDTAERQAAEAREREATILAKYVEATQVANARFTELLRVLADKQGIPPGVALAILDGFAAGDWDAWLAARGRAGSIGTNVAVADPISEVAKREGVVLR